MASTEISCINVLISGVQADGGIVATAAGDIATIYGPTGGEIDLSSMMIRIANEATSAGALVTIRAGGSSYSSIGIGNYGPVTVPTAGVVWIGGKGLESARFLNASAQSLIVAFARTDGSAGTCTCTIEALQGPFQITG